MKKVKFHFKLISKGTLANVFFYPEQEESTIILKTDSKRKEWENEEFELLIENPFEYTLKVFGVTGTEWEAELKVITPDGEKAFLKWEGETGDTKRNISVRTKPTKNIE
ncbi:hypothetical protein [Flavobacterium sp. DG2-3]|uniref:hypothetical protein n=1 Tax=Flavobacterium sp. DG2-3 TaxID=3068317 RepID=UPI00273E4AA9|nr:hypothetical protein [Flavobacterium sp. DG2-3]MDP5199811.1 hypothetical protein [Flavobacterium sp. DG2-3]